MERIRDLEHTRALERDLSECQDALGASHDLTSDLRAMLAQECNIQQRYREALQASREALSVISREQHSFTWGYLSDQLATSYKSLGECSLAERYLRRSINARAACRGWCCNAVSLALGRLESWMREWNRGDEADELRKRSDRVGERRSQLRIHRCCEFDLWNVHCDSEVLELFDLDEMESEDEGHEDEDSTTCKIDNVYLNDFVVTDWDGLP